MMLRHSKRFLASQARPKKAVESSWAVNDDNYQFWQKSPVPTDVFQKSLPRLPVPKLETTCQRYLASQKCLLTPEEFNNTEKIVSAFLANEGQKWQKMLVAQNKANKHTSYISGPWFDMYLKDRRSVSFNHNPGLALADDPRPEFQNDTSMRASNMLISSLRFLKSYQQNLLLPDAFHMNPKKTANDSFWQKVKWMPGFVATPLSYALNVFPLDMSQFPNLLQSTRIPQMNKDKIQRFPDSKHVVIAFKGNFYAFDALDSSGNLFEPRYYLKTIKHILAQNPKSSSGIGCLTSADRDTWTLARQKLVDLGNEANLKTIDSAILIICLDDWQYDPENQNQVVTELCCGTQPENRWFDKSFSMIFSNNGCVGMNFEHAWGDGVAVMRFFDDILNDNFKNAYVSSTDDLSTIDVQVQELTFQLDDHLKEEVKNAKNEHLKRLNAVEFKAFRRDGLGKADCKKAKVGPDALMQLAFQVSHLKMTGKFAATYESCSTAIYKHGRTETVRPLTSEMKTAAEAIANNDKNQLELMQKCSTAHMQMTKNAAQGQGWDRHFFALRTLMNAENESAEIFQDPAFQKINHIILSTSTLSSTNFGVGGFCPVVPDGFGLGYQIRDGDLGVCTSVFKEKRNASDMVSALESTFNALSQVIKS